MEQPAVRCLDEVHDELMSMINTTQGEHLARFKGLNIRIQEVIKDIVRKSYTKTKNLISMILEMEMTQVNTNHPDFIGSRRTLGQLIAKVSNEVVPQNQGADDDDDDEDDDTEDDSEDDGSDDDDEKEDEVISSATPASGGSQIFKIEIIETILLKKLLKSYFRVVRLLMSFFFLFQQPQPTQTDIVGTQKGCRLYSKSDSTQTHRSCTSDDAIRIGWCAIHQ